MGCFFLVSPELLRVRNTKKCTHAKNSATEEKHKHPTHHIVLFVWDILRIPHHLSPNILFPYFASKSQKSHFRLLARWVDINFWITSCSLLGPTTPKHPSKGSHYFFFMVRQSTQTRKGRWDDRFRERLTCHLGMSQPAIFGRLLYICKMFFFA